MCLRKKYKYEYCNNMKYIINNMKDKKLLHENQLIDIY